MSLLSTLNMAYVETLVAVLNDPCEYDKLCEDTYSTSKGLVEGLILTITYMGIEVLYEHRTTGCGKCEVAFIDRLSDISDASSIRNDAESGMGDRLLNVLKQARRCYSCDGWFVILFNCHDKKYCSTCFMDCISYSSEDTCSICLEPLEGMSVWNLSLFKGKCKHEFHQKCLFTLSNAHPDQTRFQCPLCRGSFTFT